MMNNTRFYLSFILFLSLSANSFCQKEGYLKHETFNWSNDVSDVTLDSTYSTFPFVVLKNEIIYDYQYNENGILSAYTTFYKKIKINDDLGIEYNNKVYIPLAADEKLLTLKARSVQNGRVNLLGKDDLKDVEELAQYGNFKIFAFKGLEKGSIVEYYYTTYSSSPNLYGSIYFQKEVPVLKTRFVLASPVDTQFDIKGTNDVSIELDSLSEEYNLSIVEIDTLEEQREETYAATMANKTRIDFNYAGNLFLPGHIKNQWKYLGELFYRTYSVSTKRGEKLVKKLLKKEIDIKGLSTKEKVLKIENYIKNPENFSFDPTYEGVFDLEKIIKNRKFHFTGMSVLFAQLLDKADVNYELVLTTDRFQKKFDPDFKSMAQLNEMAFYIPEIDQYVSASDYNYRLGIINPKMTNQEGLFISSIESSKGEKKSMSKTRFIDPLPHQKNYSNMVANIKFNPISNPKIDVKHTFGGIEATMFKTDYAKLTDDQKKQYESFFKQLVSADAEMDQISFDGNDMNLSPYDHDLIVNMTLQIPSLTEKAGKNYLFNVGQIIGEQVQMYQEKERQNDAELEFAHEYSRTIHFKIPEGYTLKGLDDLDIEIEHTDKQSGEKTMGFVSSYDISEQNEVTIRVYEYYANTLYEKELFENFRKVINAAADFNKIVLVFEK